jgi:UDP-2,3-diacylglucosamine pyrophosphatase LpxH
MKYRTIIISDFHLAGACNRSGLHRFLEENDADTWYLNGDIIDFWALRRSRSWTNEDSGIIQKLLKKARHGQRIIVLPGNHDPNLRHLIGFELGNISVIEKALFETIDGRKFIVMHGDVFDSVIGHAQGLAKIGAVVYDWLVTLNTSLNWIRRLFGLEYWSFSAAIKKAVKEAVSYVSDFEQSVMELARSEKVDGIICGHIHTPCIKKIDEVLYINCGDWVESLTAVVETDLGELELIRSNH